MGNTNLLFFGTAEIESGMPSSYSSVNVSHNVLKIPQKFFFISHFFVTTTCLISNSVDRETTKKNVRSSNDQQQVTVKNQNLLWFLNPNTLIKLITTYSYFKI